MGKLDKKKSGAAAKSAGGTQPGALLRMNNTQPGALLRMNNSTNEPAQRLLSGSAGKNSNSERNERQSSNTGMVEKAPTSSADATVENQRTSAAASALNQNEDEELVDYDELGEEGEDGDENKSRQSDDSSVVSNTSAFISILAEQEQLTPDQRKNRKLNKEEKFELRQANAAAKRQKAVLEKIAEKNRLQSEKAARELRYKAWDEENAADLSDTSSVLSSKRARLEDKRRIENLEENNRKLQLLLQSRGNGDSSSQQSLNLIAAVAVPSIVGRVKRCQQSGR